MLFLVSVLRYVWFIDNEPAAPSLYPLGDWGAQKLLIRPYLPQEKVISTLADWNLRLFHTMSSLYEAYKNFIIVIVINIFFIT